MTGTTTRRKPILPTVILLLGAFYCLFPVAWLVIASTKSAGQLFGTFTLEPGTGFAGNLRQLFHYQNGVYFSWVKNTVIYAFGGAALSTLISAMGGYALAKFVFAGRETFFRFLVAGVLVPAITLAIPQYFLMAKIGLADTYWSVLLPCLVSPFGIYLCRVYASAAIPDEMLEAARIDGASEWRLFWFVAMPVMAPGLVTVFLLQFVGIWNNFLLPYLMLSDPAKFPLTLGLYTLISQGNGQTTLYSALLIGVAISVLPLIAIILFLQRFWKMDLISGGVKG